MRRTWSLGRGGQGRHRALTGALLPRKRRASSREGTCVLPGALLPGPVRPGSLGVRAMCRLLAPGARLPCAPPPCDTGTRTLEPRWFVQRSSGS